MDSQAMPPKVLLAAVLVLIYTLICLLSACLLLWVLWRGKESYSYVWLIAIATLLNCINTLCQETYYMAWWRQFMIARYEASIIAYEYPQLSLGPLNTGFEAFLYWTLFYIYNVEALLFLFWATSLTFTVWHWRLPVRNPEHVAAILDPLSKVVAFVVPATFTAIHFGLQRQMSVTATFFVTNILFLVSFTLAAVCMLFIIIKYLQLRRSSEEHRATSIDNPFGALTDESSLPASDRRHKRQRSKLGARVDSLLLLRFMIACVILLAFEAYLLVYSRRRYERVRGIASLSGPDLSVKSSVINILNFIPGVTSGLLVFFLFGTTETHREQYAMLLRRMLCLPPKGPSRRGTVVSLRTLRIMSRSQSTPGYFTARDPKLANYDILLPTPKAEDENIQIISNIMVAKQVHLK